MVAYKIYDKEITEIDNNIITVNQYFEQAKEAYLKDGAYDMTFLPVAEDATKIMRFPLVCNEYGYKNNADKNAYAYIMQKTLEKTFEQGNPAHDSALIIAMSSESARDDYKPNDAEYRRITYAAMCEHMRKDKEWFGKLEPAAQLAAIGLEMHVISHGSTPSLQYEEGLKLDFTDTPEHTYSADLEQAANIVLQQVYQRREYSGSFVDIKPMGYSQLKWEVKAAALEAQLKSHSSRGKIPSLPVFVDLLKTAEKPAQQLKLAELAKEPDFNESMRYDGFRNELRQSFKDIAPCGEATQKLFYEVLYNFDLRGFSEPKLQLTDINFGTLQAAVAECKAQRIVDEVNNRVDLNYKEIAKLDKKLKTERLSKQEKEFIEKQADDLRKKNVITGIPDIELVAKYRPEFLEQPAKMTPDLCAQIVNKYGDKLSAQTQLEMMTKVVENMLVNRNKDEENYYLMNNYIERAANLNTSSQAMKKFCKALELVIVVTQEQYDKDKSHINKSLIAKANLRESERDKELFEQARYKYMDLLSIEHKIEELCRDGDCKCVEPSKESVAAVWEEIKSGKAAKLSFEPKTGLGRLMMNKNAKKIEKEMQEAITKFNSCVEKFAPSSEFKYVKGVSEDETYFNTLAQKEEKIIQIKREIGNNYYDYTSDEEKRVAAFEKYKIADKFAALEQQFEERSKEMQGRARTDLAMQFGEQQFGERSKEMQGRARTDLAIAGLVKEEEMAQGIYKAKIAELRQSIKDGIKQDMTDRGVNEKPSLDNPNEVGKPMTAEGTKKIRKNMKDLKQYKQLVKE